MIKPPSLTHIWQESSRALRRFPFVILSAATATFATCVLVRSGEQPHEGFWHNLLITAALGLPFFTALTVLGEKQKWRTLGGMIMQGVGALALAGYFFSLPEDVFARPERHVIRFVLLNIGLHALVAFTPFLRRNEYNGFWQFNKNLFLRFLTAALYSGVLYLGLALALQAIENLFEVHIPGERYGQLWAVIAGLFNTCFFLAGVPEDLDVLERETHFPKGLKVFVQYILIPLVVIYLVILYAYAAKITLAWNWPKGWVANLVLGFAVSGILSLLLVYPIQQQAEQRWLRIFSRWYYIALVPLVVMLLLAIGRRISEYGITENRYFVLAMGLALAGVVLYFIFSRNKNIKIIPLTLCAVAFFSAFGPWGAFQVSEQSQVARLGTVLSQNQILVEGKVQKAPHPVPFHDRQQISSMVSYLERVHGYQTLQPWFEQDLTKLPAHGQDSLALKYNPDTAARVMELMGVAYANPWDKDSTASNRFSFSALPHQGLQVGGYDCVLFFNADLSQQHPQRQTTCGERRYTMRLDVAAGQLTLAATQPQESLSFPLAPWLDNLTQTYGAQQDQVPSENMTIAAASDHLAAQILVSVVNGERQENKMVIEYVRLEVVALQNRGR